jgi:hypothetical protein
VQVDDIGRLLDYGEFWQFVYDGCGHATDFPRDRSTGDGYDPTWLIRDIRQYHAKCWECAHPAPEPPPDLMWWLQDVHYDRRPVQRRLRVAPVELSGHRVVIEGVFPDLVRFRLPAWSDDAVLYIERKRLPTEVDAHLLHAGYRTCSMPATSSPSTPSWTRSRPRR